MASAALVGACGDDSNDPYLLSCDVRVRQCQAAIYASLAPMLGADPDDLPAVRVITRSQLSEELISGTSAYTLPEDGPEQRAYEVMGFVQRTGRSPMERQFDYLVAAARAYYEGPSRRITIVEREFQTGEAQRALAHEFMHAIQHREFGFPNTADLSIDEHLAVISVPEGDAVRFTLEWAYRAADLELDSYIWGYESDRRWRGLMDEVRDREASFFYVTGLFPYVAGMKLARGTLGRGGLEGRADLFRNPPATSRNVSFQYYPEIIRSPLPVEPIELGIVPPDGYRLAATDSLGAWFFYTHLRRAWPEGHLSSLGNWSDSDDFILSPKLENGGSNTRRPHGSWRGDNLHVYEREDETVAIWTLRLANSDSVPNEGVELAYAMLREGAELAPWSVRQIGLNEVALIFAENPATIAAWEAQPVEALDIEAPIATKRRGARRPASPSCVLFGPASP